MLSEGMIWLVRSCPYNAKSSFGTLCVKSTKMTMSVSEESAGDEEVLQAARKADHVRMAGRMQATDRRSRKSGVPLMWPLIAVQGDLRPPVQFRKFRISSEDRRRHQLTKLHVGLTV